MRFNHTILVTILVAVVLLPLITAGAGTRSGNVGWQHDTFAQNLEVTVSPEDITTMDRITVTITSKVEEVWIKQAAIWGVVYPSNGVQFPFSFPFQRKTDTRFECVIEPFPLNGYRIDFYIVAYDFFYSQMDSRSSMSFSYQVAGSGWRHASFDDNIDLRYWPPRANATEEVVITLRSIENVTISGANLYIAFETPEGDMREGGWNFSRTNVNSTEMRQKIPGYPAGTNVTFWVTAWDQYNAVITSRMYNYSVVGISEYTDFPFEYTGDAGDRSVWIPDDSILLPMAGMAALAIPLFIYLYAIDRRRRERAVDLIKAKEAPPDKDAAPEEKEVFPDE